MHPLSRTLATGTSDGSVYIHEIPSTLCVPKNNERPEVLAILENESKRERATAEKFKELIAASKEKSAIGSGKGKEGIGESLYASAADKARDRTEKDKVSGKITYAVSEDEIAAAEKNFFKKMKEISERDEGVGDEELDFAQMAWRNNLK